MNFLSKLRTYLALGIINIARVAAYRVGLKTGLHPVLRIVARVPTPPFFHLKERRNEVPRANMTWHDSLCWFGYITNLGVIIFSIIGESVFRD